MLVYAGEEEVHKNYQIDAIGCYSYSFPSGQLPTKWRNNVEKY